MSVLGAHVCEPWGELWQQQGGALFLSSDAPAPGCFMFNLTLLARWWSRRRMSRPFLDSIQDRDTRALLRRKTRGKALAMDEEDTLHRLLSSATHDGYNKPLSFRSCAFVGSGHDLRCGLPRGAEIDAHDAIFRANAFQAPPLQPPNGAGPKTSSAVTQRRLEQKRTLHPPQPHCAPHPSTCRLANGPLLKIHFANRQSAVEGPKQVVQKPILLLLG